VGALAAQRRCLLPADVLAAHGLVPEGVVLNPADPALPPALRALAREGMRLLDEGRDVRLPRPALAAALPAVLARRDFRRGIPSPGPRGLGDRLAVTLAGLTGRL